MASSSPAIVDADLPSGKVPPDNSFTVTAEVRQQPGPDPWGSSGGCTAANISLTGWVTPVTLWIDGERVATTTKCITPGASKTATLTARVPAGATSLELRVHQVGDVVPNFSSWKDHLGTTTFDDVRSSITTDSEASDPTMPSGMESITMALEDFAGALGTSIDMVVVGLVAAVVLFVVVL